MNFELTPEQREVQATVRQFVDERVLPNAIENDINHHLDMGVIEGMAELGLLGIVIPEEYGGAGMDFVCEALSCEEIERGESAFRTLISVHVGLNSLSLLRYADEEQKQRYLAPQARGEKLACWAPSRQGSDVASMLTNASRDGDRYILNGQKNWISYASVADHSLVFARPTRRRSTRHFRLHRRARVAGRDDRRHGAQARRLGGVDRRALLRERRGAGGEPRRPGGPGLRDRHVRPRPGAAFTVAAGALGVIRACLERSGRVRAERETFGKPIGKNQFVQDLIAQMVLDYETSKLLVMQAAWLKDKGVRNTRETSLAKWHATESAFKAAHNAIQVHGAYGYSAEYGIERYFRNARAPIIYEGTTQIHKMMQAEHALGWRNLNGRDDVSPSHRGLPRSWPALGSRPRRGARPRPPRSRRAADRRRVHARRLAGRCRARPDPRRGAGCLGSRRTRLP